MNPVFTSNKCPTPIIKLCSIGFCSTIWVVSRLTITANEDEGPHVCDPFACTPQREKERVRSGQVRLGKTISVQSLLALRSLLI